MTTKHVVRLVARAAMIGLFMAILLSTGQRVSAEAWLAAAAVWIAWSLVVQALQVAAVEPARIVVFWRWRPRRASFAASTRPRSLRSLDGLLRRAQANPRLHAYRLRQRLAALAAHHLRVRRGIDLDRDPARGTALLGETAWLIDPAVTDRAPTLTEIDTFLDIILVERDAMTTKARP